MGALRSILDEKPQGVHAIHPDATVCDAVMEMCRLDIGSLLVRDGETTVGIVSERDVITKAVLQGKVPAHTKIADIMTTELSCIPIAMDPEDAMAIMTERRRRHLPVVDGGRVVGVISIGDLVRWVSRKQAFEIRALTDYVAGSYLV